MSLAVDPPRAPTVTAVVVSYNTRDEVLRCLASLRSVKLPLEVIVVDNASADGTTEAIRRDFPEARLIEAGANLGFSRANNLALREAKAPYALILNSDAEVRPGAVEILAALLDAQGDVGIAGPWTTGTDGTPQVSFGPDLTPLAEWRQRRLVRAVRRRDPAALREIAERGRQEHEPDWVSASCLIARMEALRSVGFLDECFFLYEEDADLCLRVRRAGWRVVFTPRAEVVHHLGRSIERVPSLARLEYHRSHVLYYRKHNGALPTALLRLYLVGAAAWGLLRSLGPGEERRERRRGSKALLALAWPGRHPDGR